MYKIKKRSHTKIMTQKNNFEIVQIFVFPELNQLPNQHTTWSTTLKTKQNKTKVIIPSI